MSGLRTLLADASHYLGSVLIGVLLAPVVPDIFVDAFGADSPSWRNPVLRLSALLLIFGCCLGFYRWRLWVARRRAARDVELTGVGKCDVAVVPMGERQTYLPRNRRTGERSSLEYLVDKTRPEVVVGVMTPQSKSLEDDVCAGLDADGVKFLPVVIDDGTDPRVAVPCAERDVLREVADHGLGDKRIYVDTTGGTVPMSLAMIRVATLLRAECTYVSSRRENGHLVAGSQRGHAFDPATLFNPPGLP